MKNSFKYIGSAIVAGLLLSSCSLDEDNPHAGDATLNNFQAWYGMQATCYFPLNNELYSSSDWLIMAETGTDIWVSSNNGDYAKQIFNYEEFGTSTNNSKKLWKQAYTTISTCNTVINEVDNILDGEADAKNILVAEAKTLRAFYYSLLVSQFGPVTLNLESSSSITGIVDLYPKRASEKDIYAQIIKDLSEAIPVLPVEPYGGNRARVTKKTAKGLLCRVYAQRAGLGDKFFGDGKEYWTLARDCAEDMITNKGTYGAYLYSDIADMWADAN
ncbi:RagB/SusD family nutrient uptake outer membrane protein, partial [uncultured Duncaniella sp.]